MTITVDGIAEAIVHGETGFLCAPGEIAELVSHCLTLLRNPDLRRVMGQQGREFANREFDVRRMVAQIAALYEMLLKGKGKNFDNLR